MKHLRSSLWGAAPGLLLISFAYVLHRQPAAEVALAVAAGAVLALFIVPARLGSFVALAATGTLFAAEAVRSSEGGSWEQIVLPLTLLGTLLAMLNVRRGSARGAGERAPLAPRSGSTPPSETSLLLVSLHPEEAPDENEAWTEIATDVLARTKSAVRATDTIEVTSARVLSIVLAHTGPLEARTVGERIRLLVAGARSDDLPLAASIGTATCPRDAATPEALDEPAMRALEQAKTRGGNRTVMASADPGTPPGWVCDTARPTDPQVAQPLS